jgi:uncharacterized protein with ATP-grasp and redox domains
VKIYLDCYACFVRQALDAARLVGCDDEQQYSVVKSTLALLQNITPGTALPEIAGHVHRLVRNESSAIDPYKEYKALGTQQALSMYPRLKALVDESSDPLGVAIRLSIAGNIMDLGFKDHYNDLWSTVERVLTQPYAIDDEGELRNGLSETDHVLFLADNAGETVFDRVLLEVLQVPVIYAVKGSPTLNDATLEDAAEAGLDQCAKIISNGTDAPGTVLSLCSKEFLGIYESAPLIIAKGQGNYESLSNAGPNVFFLLQVKCPVIARDIAAPVGSIVVRQGH